MLKDKANNYVIAEKLSVIINHIVKYNLKSIKSHSKLSATLTLQGMPHYDILNFDFYAACLTVNFNDTVEVPFQLLCSTRLHNRRSTLICTKNGMP